MTEKIQSDALAQPKSKCPPDCDCTADCERLNGFWDNPSDNLDAGSAFVTHNVDDTITIKVRSPGDRVFSEVEMSLNAWFKLCSIGSIASQPPAAPIETDCDTVKHMWGQVDKARAEGTFSSSLPPSSAGSVVWPVPKVTNPDIASPTAVPYINCLIHRVLDAQQDINYVANEGMNQSLCDAAALLEEVEQALRTAAVLSAEPQGAPK